MKKPIYELQGRVVTELAPGIYSADEAKNFLGTVSIACITAKTDADEASAHDATQTIRPEEFLAWISPTDYFVRAVIPQAKTSMH